MNKTIFFLILIIGYFSCKQGRKEQNKSNFEIYQDSLTSDLKEIHRKGHINGFGVALVDENGTLFEKGFGYSDKLNKKNYTKNTIQNIGSVSKTIIGIALLKAQEMGKLDLDDPINKYLPYNIVNPKYPKDTITIRQLATHSSSITDNMYYDNKAYILKERDTMLQDLKINENFNLPETKLSMVDFLAKILTKEGEWYEETAFTEHKPATVFEYSNIGATLAAVILEKATESTYDQFTSEHILKPLKMYSSGWSFKDIDLKNHSLLYESPKKKLPFYSLITYPDGGLITSTSDLSKYLTELIKGYSKNGALLKKGSYSEMFREQLPAKSFLERDEKNDFDDEYNTGIFMGFTPKGYLGHTGMDPGIATYMFFNPKTKIGKILMINTNISNSKILEEFYAIWSTLGKYEKKYVSKQHL